MYANGRVHTYTNAHVRKPVHVRDCRNYSLYKLQNKNTSKKRENIKKESLIKNKKYNTI